MAKFSISSKNHKADRNYPFINMKIDDNSILDSIQERSPCPKCWKSRKFFCYKCYVPVSSLQDKIPKVKLPFKIDIIKHKNEADGKSSASHAAILAADDIRVFTYPVLPDYHKEDGVILIFPGTKQSVTVNQLFHKNVKTVEKENFGFPKGYNMGTLLRVKVEETSVNNDIENNELEESETEQLDNHSSGESKFQWSLENLPIKRAIFIDSTWNQSRGIYKDERISSLKTVILQNRISQFWRHQKGSPRWFLATIEAIHQLLLETHVTAWGLNENYKGLENLGICKEFYENIITSSSENVEERNILEIPYCGQYDNLLFFFSYMYDLIHFYYDHNLLKSYKRPI